ERERLTRPAIFHRGTFRRAVRLDVGYANLSVDAQPKIARQRHNSGSSLRQEPRGNRAYYRPVEYRKPSLSARLRRGRQSTRYYEGKRGRTLYRKQRKHRRIWTRTIRMGR